MSIGLTLLQFTSIPPERVNANSSTYSVAIIDYAFQPLHINITTGTKITWTYSSSGSTIHTVTSDPGTNQTSAGPLLNSGDLGPGQSFSYTFNLPGYYPYQCAVHPTIQAMNGWINVTGNPVTSTAPPNGPGNWWLIPVYIIATTVVLVLATLIVIKRRKQVRSQKKIALLHTVLNSRRWRN